MSKNKKKSQDNISKNELNDNLLAQGETIDLESYIDEQSDENIAKVLKGKYDGYLPLVQSQKEARDFMDGLLADEARIAGADALVCGAAIKKQYNQMKSYVKSFIALSFASLVVATWSVYEKSTNEEAYEVLLQNAVQAMSPQETQKAHQTYASVIGFMLKQHPDKGIIEVTRDVVGELQKSKDSNIAYPVRHVIGHDLVAMAQAFEDMDAPRDMYLNMLVGYAKGRQGDYTVSQHSDTQIKGRVLEYIRSSHTR